MSSADHTPVVVGAAVIRPHVMRLHFCDGVVHDIQYRPGETTESLLAPLDDPDYFAQVRVDVEAGTIVWPNELDLAPEVLPATTSQARSWASTTSPQTVKPRSRSRGRPTRCRRRTCDKSPLVEIAACDLWLPAA